MPTTVRPATADDVPALTEVYAHHVLTGTATFDVDPPDEAARREWLAGHAGGPHRVVVAEVDGRVQGFAASSRFRPRAAYDTSVETSVYLRAGAVGQGLGSALYAGLFDALADQGLHRAYAAVALPNPASEALHRRFGFAVVGTLGEVGFKFGRFHDVRWFEKPLAP
ncbi:GNAT family N-acetyltransferase [Modestobacter sp. I12A-02628]|uniref:N-acetyltransferase n=1 Tax=Goekera deserti TaxID=2497753 RepID=A0A7K3WJN9_9ACTN|nr:GNAT family N-acetyltransferase [Goekera deserti]MPR00544.1 GNAT family N-acetyltransferase [Goekera deserti]NDI50480.1 GNAT family N-acetyltransferase [Goekera deserti]NEL56576.1 N-acetyltransferase [Goekera deserti]